MEQDRKGEDVFDKNDGDEIEKSTGGVQSADGEMSENVASQQQKPEGDVQDGMNLQCKDASLIPEENSAASEAAQPEESATSKADETDGENGSEADAINTEIEEQPKKKHKVARAMIYSVCIIAISVILAFAALYSFTDYIGMFRADKNASVKIPTNATNGQIASILKKDGIIRSPFVFNAYVTIARKHGFKHGTYTLNSQMSYSAIVRRLKSSGERSTVTVTIPEGYTLQKIGALLEKKKVCTKKSFLNSAESANISFDFQSQIPNNKNRFYRLEGYMFPDTYEFYASQSSDEVVKKMLEDFDNRFSAAMRKEVKSSGMTVDQIVTLASIIQAETGETSEMRKVSSVFYNRLINGVYGRKLLQSDATIFYAKRDIKPMITSSNSQIASAYNTYKQQGLPPGAICNPGLDAIKAALNPAKTSYYYFVSDKNDNYYYAKTYRKHLANVKKAMKTGAAVGTNATN